MSEWPKIRIWTSGGGSHKVRCVLIMEYAEGREARIEFDVRDPLLPADTQQGWREEFRRVADAAVLASR
jgi:hypothetical protein